MIYEVMLDAGTVYSGGEKALEDFSCLFPLSLYMENRRGEFLGVRRRTKTDTVDRPVSPHVTQLPSGERP